MAFINSYKAPPPPNLSETELYGPDPYDINFIFPLRPERLESERVKLVPFVPREHGKEFWDQTGTSIEIYRYYPLVAPTYEALLTLIETVVRADPSNALFAIYDKTRPDPAHPERAGSFAGITGLYHSSDTNLCTEIAHVIIFPPFQRTHVASHMVGILLNYCLEPPNAEKPGLGLRRVQWCTHEKNTASAGLAERMGFKREGLIRWHWVLSEVLARDGLKPGENDIWPKKYGRNTVMLAHCWDDWVNGGREVVERQLSRT